MTTPSRPADDELLAVLREALQEARDVPASFVAAGQAAFTWHSIDAELAALSYDSLAVASATRTEQAALRELTFVSRTVTIQLQVTDRAVQGQIVPPQPGRLEVHQRDGSPAVVDIDDQGWFVVTPVPRTPVRLLCRTDTGAVALTDWFTV